MSIAWWAFFLGVTVADEPIARRLGEAFAIVAVALWAFVYAHRS